MKEAIESVSDNSKGLFISGGGTKIVGLYPLIRNILDNYGYSYFSVIGGVSSGAILSYLLINENIFIEAEKEILDISLDKIFSKPPFNKDGKIKTFAKLNLLINNYLAKQDRLIPFVKKYITKQIFEEYKSKPISPNIFIGVTSLNSQSLKIYNIKNLSYEDSLQILLASTSIPIVTNYVDFYGDKLYDGGLVDHNLCNKFLITHQNRFNHIISLYSRPKNNIIITLPQIKSAVDILTFSSEIMTTEISKNDEELEKLLTDKYNIRLDQYFLPFVTNSSYEENKELLKKLYELSKQIKIV